jgi:hypothetical protein
LFAEEEVELQSVIVLGTAVETVAPVAGVGHVFAVTVGRGSVPQVVAELVKPEYS